ncbi:hypothetical protein Arth_3224 [Arthrobacter sp. FB24]|nr:hypothetical protein Arth_3224 [Arthrobacter sp. FB24]
MSEVLNSKVTSIEEGGFSRRRVVKGVAWSVPVIVTAIAAPAAAASGISATAALVGPASIITYVSSAGTGSGTNRSGTGPTGFQIQNTGSAINGSISGTINITPAGTVDAGVGMQSISQVPPTLPSYSAAHVYSGSFTSAVNIASGQTANFPVAFQYQSVNPAPKKGTQFSYTLTITLRLPDGTDRVMTGALTVTY